MFIMFCRHGRGVKHFNVAKQNGNYFLKDRLFHSINDLILHYRTHDVPNVEGITNVRLVTPIVSQSFETASVKSSGLCKMSGSHYPLQEQSNSRSRLSSHSTEKNINILSMSKPCQMHDSKTTSFNSFNQLSGCHSVLGNFQPSDELASGFASASSNSSDYLFGRLPPKKSSVRCHQRLPRRLPRSLPTEMAPNLYYSTVRDTYKELAPNLIKMLCEVENSEDERCICGLLYEEAELIMGWTMHLSTEPESEGKLFFMGPDGETAWQLPPEILLNLSLDHQHRIQELSRDHS